MKKTIGIITILIMMLIGLTGCLNIDYEVVIKSNGSGEISYVCGISKEALQSVDTTSEEFLSSLRKQAEDNKYKTTNYEDEKVEGFKATKKIKDITKDLSLEEAFGKSYIEDKEENAIRINKNFYNVQISQNAKIDLTSLDDMESIVQMTYKVRLPIKATSSNATEVSKNHKVLTWKLVGGQINNIEFTANKVNTTPIICIVLLLLIIIAAVVYLVIYIKKKKVTKE